MSSASPRMTDEDIVRELAAFGRTAGRKALRAYVKDLHRAARKRVDA